MRYGRPCIRLVVITSRLIARSSGVRFAAFLCSEVASSGRPQRLPKVSGRRGSSFPAVSSIRSASQGIKARRVSLELACGRAPWVSGIPLQSPYRFRRRPRARFQRNLERTEANMVASATRLPITQAAAPTVETPRSHPKRRSKPIPASRPNRAANPCAFRALSTERSAFRQIGPGPRQASNTEKAGFVRRRG